HPANAHTNRLIAAPTPASPCGRNGSKFSGRDSGAATTTTPTTITTSAPVRASCTQPAIRSPKKLEMNGGTKIRAATATTTQCGAPKMSTMYEAPSTATTGAPPAT